MIHVFIHVFLLLAMPPLMMGVINKTKAIFAGRVGPPLLQPYFDIIKLMRKGLVISITTTWVFMLAPVIALCTVVLAGLMIPLGRFDAPISFTGDLIMFAYLLGVGRFFTATAALDTGSAFEGMGASREVSFACLSEPALFLGLLALSRISSSLSLNAVMHGPLHASLSLVLAPLVLVSIGFFVVFLVENCRIPVDDPNTHLELTMIHEVMVLDHSGPLLGLILYSASIKLFVLGALFLHTVMLFHTGSAWLDWGFFVAGLLLVAVITGVVESLMARLQIRNIPYLLVTAILFCGFGFILLVR